MRRIISLITVVFMLIQVMVAMPVFADDTVAGGTETVTARTITVDPSLESDTEGVSYKTVNGAVNYVNFNKPTSEEERITIEIMPGTYREFIDLEAPYITMKKKEGTEGDVKLTYYLGQINNYYSYNEYWDNKIELIKASTTMTDEEKTAAISSAESRKTFSINENGEIEYVLDTNGNRKTTGTQNSASFTVEGTADYFIAEEIIFENSYNIEVVPEEDTDIVDAATNSALTARKKDPTTQQTQSVAIRVSGDKVIFRNCEMYGRQDTLYIKDQGRMYFENCYIEGTVDYIFGDAIAVFNKCTLNSPYGTGHVTAASHAATSPVGYLFIDCEITREAKNGKSAAAKASYTLGRPWKPDANVTYVNCKMDEHIGTGSSRFADMSGSSREKAYWQEYNTMDINGKANLSSVKASYETILTEADLMIKYNAWNFLKAPYDKDAAALGEPDNWDPMGVKDLYTPDKVSEAVASTLSVPSGLLTENIELATSVDGNADIKIAWTSSNKDVISADGVINLGSYGDKIKTATLTAVVSQPDAKDIVREFKVYVGNSNIEVDKVFDFESEEKSVFELSNADYLKDSEFAMGAGKEYLDNISWGIAEENGNKGFNVKQTGTTKIDEAVHANKGIHDFKYDFGDRLGDVTEISFDVAVKTLGTKAKFEFYIRPADSETYGAKSIAQFRFEPTKISDGRSTNTFVSGITLPGNKYTVKAIIDASNVVEANFDSVESTLAPVISYYVYDENGNRIGKSENCAPYTAIGGDVTVKNFVPGSITIRPDRTIATGIDFTVDNVYVRSLNEISEKDLADVSAQYKGSYINSIDELPKYGKYGSELSYEVVSGDVQNGGEITLKATAEYGAIAATAAVDEAFTVVIGDSSFMVGGDKLEAVIESGTGLTDATVSYTSDRTVTVDSIAIFALYKNGILEKVATKSLKENDKVAVDMDGVTISAEEMKNYSIKVMAWSDFGNATPIDNCDYMVFE